jgi:hypothetical protein
MYGATVTVALIVLSVLVGLLLQPLNIIAARYMTVHFFIVPSQEGQFLLLCRAAENLYHGSVKTTFCKSRSLAFEWVREKFKNLFDRQHQ